MAERAPVHVADALADLAWERYEQASERAARIAAGTQLEIEETAFAERAEWRGIALACEREAAAHSICCPCYACGGP